MVWPSVVTEIPRNLEPAGEDTFVQDLNRRTAPRRADAPHRHPSDPSEGVNPGCAAWFPRVGAVTVR